MTLLFELLEFRETIATTRPVQEKAFRVIIFAKQLQQPAQFKKKHFAVNLSCSMRYNTKTKFSRA